eukprot:6482014-Prymnesium_polylepis.1
MYVEAHTGAAPDGEPNPSHLQPIRPRSSVSECEGKVSLVGVGARGEGDSRPPHTHMLRCAAVRTCAALRALRALRDNARLAATTDVHG